MVRFGLCEYVGCISGFLMRWVCSFGFGSGVCASCMLVIWLVGLPLMRVLDVFVWAVADLFRFEYSRFLSCVRLCKFIYAASVLHCLFFCCEFLC